MGFMPQIFLFFFGFFPDFFFFGGYITWNRKFLIHCVKFPPSPGVFRKGAKVRRAPKPHLSEAKNALFYPTSCPAFKKKKKNHKNGKKITKSAFFLKKKKREK